MLKEMVDVRARQGYSVWKAETFVINGQQGGSTGSVANHGGSSWGAGGMYGELLPGFWEAIDEIVGYVNSQGMVVSLAFAGIGRGMPTSEFEPQVAALARYAVARYAAFSTVWTTCQEYVHCGISTFASALSSSCFPRSFYQAHALLIAAPYFSSFWQQ
jgi:hypothetical protein